MKNKDLLVSVIIPVYNTAPLLPRCIESVISQTYKFIEIILINDGSTDDSLYICQKYAKQDERIKLIDKKNEGQSIARNIALDLIQGDYVLFIDSDDYISTNMIETLVSTIKETNTDLIRYNLDAKWKEKLNTKDDFLNSVYRDELGGQLWTTIFKVQLWSNIRLPIDRYAEDAAVMHKLILESTNPTYIYNNLYYYNYQNPSSSSNNPNKLYKNTVDRAIMFIDRLTWGNKHNHVIDKKSLDIVFSKAVYFSLGSLGLYKKYAYNNEDITRIIQFNKKNLRRILKSKHISLFRKMAIIFAISSPSLYYRIRSFTKLIK